MDSLKIAYEDIKGRLATLNCEIDELEQDEKLKRYKKLIDQRDELRREKKMLYNGIKLQEYDECKHILVTTAVDWGMDYGSKTRSYHGCIKCGLDESAVKGYYWSGDLETMQTYFSERAKNLPLNNSIPGKIIECCCDIDLAIEIYGKIKENYPDIDDATAIKYFEKALGDIRNIEVNDERKESRAKRLNLCKDFKNWKADSVYYY